MTNLPKTSFNSTSHERYVIDAAVLLKDLEWSGGEWTFEELGATSGAVSIEVEMSYRQMEVNGASHVAIKQHAVLEEFNATATAAIKEMSAKIIQQAINGKIETEGGDLPEGYSKVTAQRFLDEDSFLKNIAFVGRLSSHNDEAVIAVLDNPRVDEGLSGETEDNGEMAIEQTYRAYADIDDLRNDLNYLPLKFYLPNSIVDGAPEQMNITGTSTANLLATTSEPKKDEKQEDGK